jgi:hypothetical protein
MVKEKPINVPIIQCIGNQYSAVSFGTLKYHRQGVKHVPAEMVPNVLGSREGWELYIVSGGVVVGILLGKGAVYCDRRCDGWDIAE